MKHNDYKKHVMLSIQTKYKNIRIWSNETGLAYAIPSVKKLISAAFSFKIESIKQASKELRLIKYGLEGSSDILGVMPNGIILCIEIKVGRDKQREDQVAFQNMIERNNGLYFLVDDKTSIDSQIENTVGEFYVKCTNVSEVR